MKRIISFFIATTLTASNLGLVFGNENSLNDEQDIQSISEIVNEQENQEDEVNIEISTPILSSDSALSITPTVYDSASPELIGEISIDMTEVDAPGIITVTAKAADNVSGIRSFYMYFKGTKKTYTVYMEKGYYDELENKYIEYPDQVFKGNIIINSYDFPSVCSLTAVYLWDQSGNYISYQNENRGQLPLPNDLSFTIKNDLYDDAAPELIGDISFDKTEITAPGVITITARAKDNLSGIDVFQITFRNENKAYSIRMQEGYYDELQGKYIEYPDNIFKGILTIDSYEPSAVLSLNSISLTDKSGNTMYYDSESLPNNISYTIRNEKPANLITSSINPNLIQDIVRQPDDAVIKINYFMNPQINGEVFEVIKGTDKTLIFELNGVQWVFNGKDIENPKSIDLTIRTNYLLNSLDSLKDIVQDVPTAVLSFSDNGVLPGKVKIRISPDYHFKKHLGIQNLYVYFYDMPNKELVLTASSLKISEIDGYFEFEIHHNSDYIITKGEVKQTLPVTDMSDIIAVNIPFKASLSEVDKSIFCQVPYSTNIQSVDVSVSEGASWKLYKDSACENEITEKTLHLIEGINTAYIKVTSKNGINTNVYTISIVRESSDITNGLSDITAVNTPSGATLSVVGKTITYDVFYSTSIQPIDVSVSEGATWKLYKDSACENEITEKTMYLIEGVNNAYIKVTSRNAVNTKIYTITIIRASSSTAKKSSSSSSSSTTNGSVVANTTIQDSAMSKDATSKTIQDSNNKNITPRIILAENLKSAIFSGKDLLDIANNSRDIIIVSDKIQITLTDELIGEMNLINNSNVEVLLSKIEKPLNSDLTKKLFQTNNINQELIRYNYLIELVVDGNKIVNTSLPLKVTIDTKNWNIKEEQKNNFTGIVYDKNLQTYKQLGGEFSADGKSFSFYTDRTGIYGVIISDNLMKIQLKVDSKSYYINDTAYNSDVAPIIFQDRTIIPLRLVSEALGANVSWNESSKTVTLTKHNKTVSLIINEPFQNNMGTPIILNNRTYVPVRYIAEALGANVVWNFDTKEISIYQ